MSAPLPAFAYVPGQTARHPEGAFDALKDLGKGALHNSPAWHHGLQLLRAGYFWEAHEVLEAVWLASSPNSPEKLCVQGVIQLANAALKARMGQARAHDRLRAQSTSLLAEALRRAGGEVMGLTEKDIVEMHDSCR